MVQEQENEFLEILVATVPEITKRKHSDYVRMRRQGFAPSFSEGIFCVVGSSLFAGQIKIRPDSVEETRKERVFS